METVYCNESNVIVNSKERTCSALTTKNNRCKMKVKCIGKDGAWHGIALCQLHYDMVPNIKTIYHSNS